MMITGERRLQTMRAVVWQALNDPEVLQVCVPGCTEIRKESDSKYEAVILARVGPVRGEFKVHLLLSELEPPQRYTLIGEGSGGMAGFCRGTLKVSLNVVEEGTLIVYSAEVIIGGRMAQVGARFTEPVARKFVDGFFRSLEDACSPGSMPEDGIPRKQTSECPPTVGC